MAITVTREAANTYFGVTNHINYGVWFGFSDDQMDASLAHATRIITRLIGVDVTTETTSTPASYRPDYAVFEQALYMMVNGNAIADGTETGPKFFGDDGTGEPRERTDMFKVCKEALEWLDVRSGASVPLIRGA